MSAEIEENVQPLERLFLSPRPLPVVLGWVAAFILLFLVYNGAPGRTPSAGPVPSAAALGIRDMRIGLWEAPQGLFNPLFATNAADREINAFLFEGLLRYGPDLRPEPNLASYEVSSDQHTIVFTLRDDARWHDGRPVTADDAAFTLRTVLRKDYRGPFRGRFTYIKGAREYQAGRVDDVAGVQVTDPATLAVTLDKPYGPALGEIGALPILPLHAFDGIPVTQMEQAPASRAPIGAGPFRLISVSEPQPGQAAPAPAGVRSGANEIRLYRFNGYFRGQPRLKEIVFTAVGAALDLSRLGQAGIDLVRVRWQDVRGITRAAGYSLQEWPQPGYYYIGMNLARSPLNDQRFRQALAYAVDRPALVDDLFAGHATLVHAPVFPGSWAEAAGINPYVHDVDRALQLLGETGWRDSNGDGRLDRWGDILTLNLMYEKDKEPYRRLAVLVREHLGQVGIRVQLQPVPREVLFQRVFGRRDFDLYILDWRMGPDPDASALFGREARVNNAVGFRYREAQDLLARGVGTVAIESRQPIYESWTRMANEQLPYIFLFSPNDMVAISDRLWGLTVTPLGYHQGAEEWGLTR